MRLKWKKYLPDFINRRIEASPQLQGIVSNTGWMMGDKLVRKAVGLLVGVLLARYLGPALFGEFSYALALVMIMTPVAILSLDMLSIKRLIQQPSSRDEVLGTSFFLMTAGGVLAFGLALALIYLLRPDDSLMHWLVGILAASSVAQVFIIIEFWFESQLQWKLNVYAKTSAFLLLSIIKIGLILMQAPLIAFAWAGLAETIAGSIGLLIVYRTRGYSVRAWHFSRPMAKSLLRDSWPLITSGLLTVIYMRIDQVMIGTMISSEELGNYSVAVQVSEVWFFIPIVICSSVFPAIVEAEAYSEELLQARMQQLYRLMAFFAYTVALPIAFFSTRIIEILFSTAYSDAGPLLAILIWTGVFTSFGAARHQMIVAKNWTRVDLVSIAMGCALNIFLNLLLIPDYGAMGAVIATFISYWFSTHGSCFLFKPLRKTGWMITKAMLYPKFW
jgi:O-antigen/teichoic acid export membrane protein